VFRRLEYGWRVAATGFAFAALGLGALFVALMIVPVVTIGTHDRLVRARRAQHFVRASFRFYIQILQLLGVIRLSIVGIDRLGGARGTLIVANHPTLLDVVLIMALVPNAQCVVKHQLAKNPFLAPIVKAAGYILNDIDAEALIERCRQTLDQGSNLIIFPEGTRSRPGSPIRLQRGFAHIATSARVDLQLITITCTPITLTKGSPWYAIPERRAHFQVEIGDRLAIGPFLAQRSRPLGVRMLVRNLESYFARKLAYG
jgi:1-acyl-sn-glycerol-3-phosphate acyltransferase